MSKPLLQAAYTLGHQYLTLDRASGAEVGSGFHFRDNIKKTPKPKPLGADVVEIPTGVFQDGTHNGLSALLCSRVDAVNHRGELDDDYQLVPNPHADVPLPPTFRFRGTYYAVENAGDEYKVTPQEITLPM